jgi:hypothetical protein
VGKSGDLPGVFGYWKARESVGGAIQVGECERKEPFNEPQKDPASTIPKSDPKAIE